MSDQRRETPTGLILLRHHEIANIGELAVYKQHGGFEAFGSYPTR